MRGTDNSRRRSDPAEPKRASHALRGLAGFDGRPEVPDSALLEIWRALEDEAERQQSEERAG